MPMVPQEKTYDLVAIDEPFQDLVYECDTAHLAMHGIRADDASNPDDDSIARITDGLKVTGREFGGTMANTAVAVSRLGGRACFVAAMADSEGERAYRADLEQAGVESVSLPTMHEDAMGRIHSLICRDGNGQRHMLQQFRTKDPFHAADMPLDKLRDTKFVLASGHGWTPERHDALKHAFSVVREHGGKVAFSLAAQKRVEDCRGHFTELLEQDVDILFANQVEIEALYPHLENFAAVCHHLVALSKRGKTIVVTQGPQGAIIFDQGVVHQIAAKKTEAPNTVGAGDAFCGGFLYGLAHGLSVDQAGRLGAHLSSKVVTRTGVRVEPGDIPVSPTGDISASPMLRVHEIKADPRIICEEPHGVIDVSFR